MLVRNTRSGLEFTHYATGGWKPVSNDMMNDWGEFGAEFPNYLRSLPWGSDSGIALVEFYNVERLRPRIAAVFRFGQTEHREFVRAE